MAAAADTTEESVDHTILPPLRRDLIVSQQTYEGKPFYVLKDPIALNYYRLTAEDYALATLFDGKRTLAEIRHAYLRQVPHLRLTYTPSQLTEKLVRFANELSVMQFLHVQGSATKKRTAMQRERQESRWYAVLGKIFWFQASVFDPDQLFTKMARWIPWVWTKTTLWISLAIMVAAVAVFFQNYTRIAPNMDALFATHNLLLLWFCVVFVKIVHELGHGLTCKHFGGEVHEIGLMVMLFTPFFYVNVSDSWMMPKRRHRILVAAAGIYVELIIAAFATFLWAISQPGILQQALFNLMLVTSVFTVLFNANPLMRFDGYFILTDLIEVPNLRAKAQAYMGVLFQRLLFGQQAFSARLSKMALPEKHFALFVIYAFLSYAYMALILYRISGIFTTLLAPYGLQQFGQILSTLAVLAFVLLPIVRFFSSLQLEASEWQRGGRLRRLAWITTAATSIFAVVCFVPVEHTITRSSAIESANPQTIRPIVPGMIEEIFVTEGDFVRAGESIARLSNREIVQNFEVSGLQLHMVEKQIQRAMGQEKPVDFLQAKALKEQYGAATEGAQRNFSHLLLQSEIDGIVLTHGLKRKVGLLIKQGEPLCQISPLRQLLINIPLSESEVRYINVGQRVHVKAVAYPELTLTGVISQKPLVTLDRNLPPALSALRKGDVPTTADPQGRERPTEITYNAQILVDNPDLVLRPGMSGRVKIFAGKHPVGVLLYRWFLDLISLDFRL